MIMQMNNNNFQKSHHVGTVQSISLFVSTKKVQVGKDQEKAQSERDSHSKNRGGEKTKLTIRHLYHETYKVNVRLSIVMMLALKI